MKFSSVNIYGKCTGNLNEKLFGCYSVLFTSYTKNAKFLFRNIIL